MNIQKNYLIKYHDKCDGVYHSKNCGSYRYDLNHGYIELYDSKPPENISNLQDTHNDKMPGFQPNTNNTFNGIPNMIRQINMPKLIGIISLRNVIDVDIEELS